MNVKCYGEATGEVGVTVTGGNSGYTYLWNPTGKTSSRITELTAGDYSVSVRDGAGCSAGVATTITVSQPSCMIQIHACIHSFKHVLIIIFCSTS